MTVIHLTPRRGDVDPTSLLAQVLHSWLHFRFRGGAVGGQSDVLYVRRDRDGRIEVCTPYYTFLLQS